MTEVRLAPLALDKSTEASDNSFIGFDAGPASTG